MSASSGLLVLGGLLIAAIGWPLIPMIEGRTNLRGTRLPVVLGATAIGLAVPHIARMAVPRAFRVLGRNSFGIFVLNPALLVGIRLALGPPISVLDSLLRVAVVLLVATGMSRLLTRKASWAVA